MKPLDVDGSNQWMPLKFHSGKNPDGSIRTKEGYKNKLTDQEFIPEGGWKEDPPYTAERCRSVSDRYKDGWERIWGQKSADGQV